MAKTASFGVLHMGTSFGIGYALTGSVAIAGAITFVEPLVNTVMHFFFDKYWGHPKLKAWWIKRWGSPQGRALATAQNSAA